MGRGQLFSLTSEKIHVSRLIGTPSLEDGLVTLQLDKTFAARELEELFSNCAVLSVFGSGKK